MSILLSAQSGQPGLKHVSDDLPTVLSSQENFAAGEILTTRIGGFAYQVAAPDVTAPHLTTARGVPLMHSPGQEVNVMALQSASDGGDLSLTLRRAATAFPGKVLRLPPGRYSAASALEIGDLESSLFRSEGAEITVEGNVPFLRAAAPVWEEIQSIAPVEGTDYWGPRSTITCTDGLAYRAGDLVKVVSDDKQRCTRPTSGVYDYRRGFMAYVTAVAGDVLTLDRPVPWSLTTNPRIGRMPRRRYQWKGGVIRYEAGHEADWTGNAMILYGVSDLDLEVEVERTYNAAVRVLGCMDARVNAVGRDLRNNQFNRQYGYLVEDGAQGTRAHVMAGRNRHAYTTSQPSIVANSEELENYGPAYGALITGQQHGDTQAGFDTHHGSENITFANCVVSGAMKANSFVLRGLGHRLIHPQIYNAKDGLYIFTEDGVDQPTQAEIIAPHVEVDRYPLKTQNAEVRIGGDGYLRSLKYGNAVQLSGGKISIRGNHELRPGGVAEVAGRRAIELYDSQVDAREATLLFDLQDVPDNSSGYGLIEGGGETATSWLGGKLRAINDAGLSTAFYRKTGAAGTMNFGGGGLELHTQSNGANPTSSMAITGANGVGFSGSWTWRSDAGGGGSHDIYSNITATGTAPKWYNRGDRIVNWRIYSSGSHDLGILPDGTFVGQMLLISCAGGTLTLKHGATFNTLLNGTDMPLSMGEGVSLLWNGANWLRTST